jgi:hypothetical protein
MPYDLRFLRARRDRSCPLDTSGSRCRADPARTDTAVRQSPRPPAGRAPLRRSGLRDQQPGSGQPGKAYPNGAAGGRSKVSTPQSALAVQHILIVPPEAPAMQVELAANPVEPVAEAGHGLPPRAVPSWRPRQCAPAKELSPGQPRSQARSAPSRSESEKSPGPNLGTHPCQRSTVERRAIQRSPRSHGSIGATRMGESRRTGESPWCSVGRNPYRVAWAPEMPSETSSPNQLPSLLGDLGAALVEMGGQAGAFADLGGRAVPGQDGGPQVSGTPSGPDPGSGRPWF